MCPFVCVCVCEFSVERDSPKTFIRGVSCPRPVCTSVYQDLMKPRVCLNVCMCGSFVLACDSRCWVHSRGCRRLRSLFLCAGKKRSFLTIEPFYFAQLGEIFMRVYKIVIQHSTGSTASSSTLALLGSPLKSCLCLCTPLLHFLAFPRQPRRRLHPWLSPGFWSNN